MEKIKWKKSMKCQKRDASSKAKAHFELNLVREVKYFKYTSIKIKTRKNVGLLLNEVGALIMEGTEKALISLLQSLLLRLPLQNSRL